METRPISKTKNFTVISIVKKHNSEETETKKETKKQK